MNKQFVQRIFPSLMLLAIYATGMGQTQSSQPSKESAPAARPEDVDTIEHIVSAVYAAISGPPGPRDWNRFRSLFYSDARLVPSHADKSGAVTARNLAVEEYVDRAKEYFAKEGFDESSVANRIEEWNHMAHVWSTYESRHAKGEQPFARGINSFQLMNDGKRWWILSVYWQGEDPSDPIPAKYLK
jgi:hypothetical protein